MILCHLFCRPHLPVALLHQLFDLAEITKVVITAPTKCKAICYYSSSGFPRWVAYLKAK